MPFTNQDGSTVTWLYLSEGLDGNKPFRVECGIKYLTSDGREFNAPQNMSTDLATVPFPMWGIIAPFGQQSRAAVIHDDGSDRAHKILAEGDRRGGYTVRREIDYVFRDALMESTVSVFRAWLMWSGVSVARYFGYRRLGGVAIVAAILAWWGLLLTGPLGVGPWPGLPWIMALIITLAAGLIFLLAARSDWNLLAFAIVVFPLVLLVLAAATIVLFVQVIVWTLSWPVKWIVGGPSPIIKPGLTGVRLR